MTNIVLRITRHATDDARVSFLRSVYGADVRIATIDTPYGSDPIAAIQALMELTAIEHKGSVVALEVIAPLPVLMQVVNRQRDLGVAVIRAQFERGSDGRAIVTGKDDTGRDVLKFSHYERLLRVEFHTEQLRP